MLRVDRRSSGRGGGGGGMKDDDCGDDDESITVTPLGAGQDVGRSCLLLSMAGRNVVLDCGMHAGFYDDRKFPDFTFITPDAHGKGRRAASDGTSSGCDAPANALTDYIDAVIISHFHLDHSGALPYLTEMVGYDGPVYMTHPTRAIVPILLEDYRKISVERRGDEHFYTPEDIRNCMSKVRTCHLHEVVYPDPEDESFYIRPYYAGHVLGAALFEVNVGHLRVVYTGDYNMTSDRHLGAAKIARCRPHLLITESTYATTIRDSKRYRERDLLRKVQTCIDRGGKCLIPVFALGRVQELCILLESHWNKMQLNVPIYFSGALATAATNYYRLFITWTNENIKKQFAESRRNLFDFSHIKALSDKSILDQPGPMVVFATPGMLHAGLSLAIFKKWANDPLNMLIVPGYCVSGTVGAKVLAGHKKIDDQATGKSIDVRLSVEYLSFSAHADAKGIMQLISQCRPRRHVMLVHGEAENMRYLKSKIEQEFNGLSVSMPANGDCETFHCPRPVIAKCQPSLLKETHSVFDSSGSGKVRKLLHCMVETTEDSGGGVSIKLKSMSEVMAESSHELWFTTRIKLRFTAMTSLSAERRRLSRMLRSALNSKFSRYLDPRMTDDKNMAAQKHVEDDEAADKNKLDEAGELVKLRCLGVEAKESVRAMSSIRLIEEPGGEGNGDADDDDALQFVVDEVMIRIELEDEEEEEEDDEIGGGDGGKSTNDRMDSVERVIDGVVILSWPMTHDKLGSNVLKCVNEFVCLLH